MAVDMTNDDWIRRGREKDEMRLEYNRLAAQVGWSTIPKGKAIEFSRLAQQLKDLKDCIAAGVARPLPRPEDNGPDWDGVPRRAPSP